MEQPTINKERTRESVFSEWSKVLLEIRSHEAELRRKKERRNELEKKYPFLGSIKGILRKRDTSSPEKETKGEPIPKKRKKEPNSERKVSKKSKVDPELKKAIYQYKQDLNRLYQRAKGGKSVSRQELEAVVRSAGSFDLSIPEDREATLREAAGVSSSEMLNWFEEARSNLRTIADEDGSLRRVDSSHVPLYIPQASRENLGRMEVALE